MSYSLLTEDRKSIVQFLQLDEIGATIRQTQQEVNAIQAQSQTLGQQKKEIVSVIAFHRSELQNTELDNTELAVEYLAMSVAEARLGQVTRQQVEMLKRPITWVAGFCSCARFPSYGRSIFFLSWLLIVAYWSYLATWRDNNFLTAYAILSGLLLPFAWFGAKGKRLAPVRPNGSWDDALLTLNAVMLTNVAFVLEAIDIPAIVATTIDVLLILCAYSRASYARL